MRSNFEIGFVSGGALPTAVFARLADSGVAHHRGQSWWASKTRPTLRVQLVGKPLQGVRSGAFRVAPALFGETHSPRFGVGRWPFHLPMSLTFGLPRIRKAAKGHTHYRDNERRRPAERDPLNCEDLRGCAVGKWAGVRKKFRLGETEERSTSRSLSPLLRQRTIATGPPWY